MEINCEGKLHILNPQNAGSKIVTQMKGEKKNITFSLNKYIEA